MKILAGLALASGVVLFALVPATSTTVAAAGNAQEDAMVLAERRHERPAIALGGAVPCELFATNNARGALNPGGLAKLDPTTFAGTLVASSVTPLGFSGLTFTPDGRLWGTARKATSGFAGGTDLVELDPATGAVLSQKTILVGGADVRISDLTTHPKTGLVYGCGGVGFFVDLFTIDTSTAAATLVGSTGVAFGGGLAFALDGTLYIVVASVLVPTLHTLDPVTGAVLTTMGYGPHNGLDGLVVRPGDGALIGSRGEAQGGDQLVAIDPASGATTELGPTGSGSPSDLAYCPCPAVPSAEIVRLGNPPNPAAFLPGVTSGPVVGGVWDPVIDHTTFVPAAVVDFLVLSLTFTNIPSGFGTVLCGLPPIVVVLSAPGVPFAVPLPFSCTNVGALLCSQGGSVDGALAISATNALDLVIGSY